MALLPVRRRLRRVVGIGLKLQLRLAASPMRARDHLLSPNRGLLAALAAAARPEINAFTHFCLSPESTKSVTKVGYLPLPTAALVAQASRFDKKITGSVLGGQGSVTGVSLNAFDEEEKERDRIRSALVQ
jgi:hypothetical protein